MRRSSFNIYSLARIQPRCKRPLSSYPIVDLSAIIDAYEQTIMQFSVTALVLTALAAVVQVSEQLHFRAVLMIWFGIGV